MFYLIFCAVLLAFEILSALLCLLPIISGISSNTYNLTLLDLAHMGNYSGNILFIAAFSLIVIVLTIILLTVIIKNYRYNYSSNTLLFVFNLITTLLSMLRLILFIGLRVKINADIRYEDETKYYYTWTTSGVIVTILFVLNFILSSLMLVIITVNKFSTGLKKLKFFSITSGQAIEMKANTQKVYNVKNQSQNIELLEKYNELFKNGVITEEEFNEKKKELL